MSEAKVVWFSREPQYAPCLTADAPSLGLMSGEAYRRDPKHLLFTLARYKFVARLFEGRDHVLEVGCGDAFGTRLVRQAVSRLTAVDFDQTFVEDVRARQELPWTFEVYVHDPLADGPISGSFDAVYALDVLEHVDPAREVDFLRSVLTSLTPAGVAIFGMPSLEGQRYASTQSLEGHVNCKTAGDLTVLLKRFFDNVFVFGMNDEVIHTGHYGMAHYLLALCTGKRC